MKKIKKIVLSHRLLYELYFCISGKKLNHTKIDKKILNCKCNNSIKINDLIVSLTSYGERLLELKYTLFSLINQTIKPEQIVVWIAEKEEIPKELYKFTKFGVVFKHCEDIHSFKKLIPALKLFKKKCIVTADDDIYYKKDWLEKLWNCHLKYPTKKITHIAHRLKFDEEKKMLPYNHWLHNVKSATSGKYLFPTGGGGTLYPPHPVKAEFLDEHLFMELCPNADDVWFYFMGLLSDQDTVIVPHPYTHLKYVDIYREYGLNSKQTLQSINVEQNLNDLQIKNVMCYFKISDAQLFNLINQK